MEIINNSNIKITEEIEDALYATGKSLFSSFLTVSSDSTENNILFLDDEAHHCMTFADGKIKFIPWWEIEKSEEPPVPKRLLGKDKKKSYKDLIRVNRVESCRHTGRFIGNTITAFKHYAYNRHRKKRLLLFSIEYSPYSESTYVYSNGKCIRVSDHDCDSFAFRMNQFPDEYMFIDVRGRDGQYVLSSELWKFLTKNNGKIPTLHAGPKHFS